MANLLLITILLPLAGALVCRGARAGARWVALATASATLLSAGIVVFSFRCQDAIYAASDFALSSGDDAPLALRLSLGLDGLSLWFFGLVALLSWVGVLVSWEAIAEQPARFYRLLLLLTSGMFGVFAARDIILFYVFFEFTLVPLFLLVGIWGSQDRRRAALKFFLFTLVGSLITLLGLVAIVLWVYHHSPERELTFSIVRLTEHLVRLGGMPLGLQLWLFAALFAGFAIKVPLVPLHTWLPLAHVEAPTAGSVVLAGVLLKVGTYGFARFCVPMLPAAVAVCMPWLLWISLAGILYGGLVALAQQDIKRLIAWSSISHMGFCMLGLFALDRLSTAGGVLQMINHGLATGGLFAVVGMIYERYHTRAIDELGGLARRLPVLALFMLLLSLASIGLPGLNGFVGEFLILLGMFQRAWANPLAGCEGQLQVISVLAVTGVVLGAWYMLRLVQQVFFGPLREPTIAGDETFSPSKTASPPADLGPREVVALAPLAVLIVWIGIWPSFFLAPIQPVVDRLTAGARQAVEEKIEPAAVPPAIDRGSP